MADRGVVHPSQIAADRLLAHSALPVHYIVQDLTLTPIDIRPAYWILSLQDGVQGHRAFSDDRPSLWNADRRGAVTGNLSSRRLTPSKEIPITWWYVTSAESFLDLANGPDILELAPRISCPVLYVRGDREPRDLYPAEEFKRRCAGECTVETVPDCNHFYVGREDVVTALVSSWSGVRSSSAAK